MIAFHGHKRCRIAVVIDVLMEVSRRGIDFEAEVFDALTRRVAGMEANLMLRERNAGVVIVSGEMANLVAHLVPVRQGEAEVLFGNRIGNH